MEKFRLLLLQLSTNFDYDHIYYMMFHFYSPFHINMFKKI